MGRCYVIVTIDYGRWHLSISCRDRKTLPSYKEIKAARYKYLPKDITVAEIFPKPSEFVNLAEVRHLWELRVSEHEIFEPHGKEDEAGRDRGPD